MDRRSLPQPFESERLLIRAPRESDAEALVEAIAETHEQLRPWMEWAVRAACARPGYATEAVRAIADAAFAELGARRVEIRCSDANERSWRVAERAGFALEGVLRHEGRHLDGSLRDTRVYARVR